MKSLSLSARIGAEQPSAPGPCLLWSLLLVEGFCSLGLQVIAIRQLAPVVGLSVVETSLVIAGFLLGLALGYRAGGVTRANPLVAVGLQLMAAALFSTALLSPVVALMFERLGYAVGLAAYAFGLVLVIALLLGQILPLVIQAWQQAPGRSHAEVAGNALWLSTLGSMAGAAAVSVWLMQSIGVTATLAVIIATQILMAGLVMLRCRSRNASMLALTLLVLLALVLQVLAQRSPGVRYAGANAYNTIEIRQLGPVREWVANGVLMSRTGGLGGAPGYIHRLQERLRVAEEERGRPLKVLVLGAAGFTLSEESGLRYTQDVFTYVDIDPRVKDIAERHFLGSEVQGRFVASDARLFLKQTDQRFDVIVLDVFGAGMDVPEHLLTREALAQARARLRPQGHLMLNVIADQGLDSAYSRGADATIRSVTPFCRVFMPSEQRGLVNVVYDCYAGGHETPYTDDRTTSQLDFKREYWGRPRG